MLGLGGHVVTQPAIVAFGIKKMKKIEMLNKFFL
jgi:hypothetical protein